MLSYSAFLVANRFWDLNQLEHVHEVSMCYSVPNLEISRAFPYSNYSVDLVCLSSSKRIFTSQHYIWLYSTRGEHTVTVTKCLLGSGGSLFGLSCSYSCFIEYNASRSLQVPFHHCVDC